MHAKRLPHACNAWKVVAPALPPTETTSRPRDASLLASGPPAAARGISLNETFKKHTPSAHSLSRCLAGVLAVTALALSVLLTRAEDEIVVGHNSAGQLKVQVGFQQPLGLPVSLFPGSPGYATGVVGFHSAAVDEPTNDFFQLSAAADSRFILIARDPQMEVWNDHGSAYMAIGESFYMGPAAFDTHPLWNLVSGTPGASYSLILKVHDVNAVYSDSDPFILSFTPMPPALTISSDSPGLVTISWTPPTAGLVLQVSSGLAPAMWTNAPSGATNPVTVPISFPAQFYRLSR